MSSNPASQFKKWGQEYNLAKDHEVVFLLDLAVSFLPIYFTNTNSGAAGCRRTEIWIRFALGEELCPAAALASILAEGMPERAKDFSQSCVEGPRILPSIYASPGQRLHEPTCEQVPQVGKSRAVIERTSFISGVPSSVPGESHAVLAAPWGH